MKFYGKNRWHQIRQRGKVSYWIRVELSWRIDSKAVYEFGRDGAVDGHIALDTERQELFPCTEDGVATSSMRLLIQENELVDKNPEIDTHSFLEATVGIIRQWNAGADPPQSGSRYFG